MLFTFPFSSFAAWQTSDLGTVQGLRGIARTGEILIAAGNNGNILRSTDGGTTWVVADKNAAIYWQDVDVNGGTLRVVGEGGAMRESMDNGATWSNVSLGVGDNLYDLATYGNYGFAVGSGGRILSLHPHAKLWQTVTSPTTLSLQRVHILSEATAWIVGYEGVLLQTTDYGVNWVNKGKVADANLYGVWFASAQVGYVVGAGGTLRKTTDAGVSWTDVKVSGLTSQTLFDIRGSGNTIVAVGDKVVVRSTDGGATWTADDFSTERYTFKNGWIDASGTIWAVGTMDDLKSVVLSLVVASQPTASEALPSVPTVIPSEPEAREGSLIKLSCPSHTTADDPCKAVYLYGSDGKRHAFPNEKVFFTWYDHFDAVVNVSAEFLSALPLGKNVTYHPGTKMVKFASVPTVYAVEKGGVLRAIASEAVAAALYGSNWNKKVDDISDAFFGNYTFGAIIGVAADYHVADAKASVTAPF